MKNLKDCPDGETGMGFLVFFVSRGKWIGSFGMRYHWTKCWMSVFFVFSTRGPFSQACNLSIKTKQLLGSISHFIFQFSVNTTTFGYRRVVLSSSRKQNLMKTARAIETSSYLWWKIYISIACYSRVNVFLFINYRYFSISHSRTISLECIYSLSFRDIYL